MKILLLFIFLILTTCSKNTDNKQKQDLDSCFKTNNIQNNCINMDSLQTENINNQNLTINEIRDYIFFDLNIKLYFKNSEELINTLNLPKDYNVIEYFEENTIHAGVGFIYFLNIEWDQFKISYWTSDFIDIYQLLFIEVELTNNNYLHLLPHTNIIEYIADNNIGSLYLFMNPIEQQIENNILTYVIRNVDNNIEDFCRIIFINGLLNSIIIFPYLP